jgi:hypothetical protein
MLFIFQKNILNILKNNMIYINTKFNNLKKKRYNKTYLNIKEKTSLMTNESSYKNIKVNIIKDIMRSYKQSRVYTFFRDRSKSINILKIERMNNKNNRVNFIEDFFRKNSHLVADYSIHNKKTKKSIKKIQNTIVNRNNNFRLVKMKKQNDNNNYFSHNNNRINSYNIKNNFMDFINNLFDRYIKEHEPDYYRKVYSKELLNIHSSNRFLLLFNKLLNNKLFISNLLFFINNYNLLNNKKIMNKYLNKFIIFLYYIYNFLNNRSNLMKSFFYIKFNISNISITKEISHFLLDLNLIRREMQRERRITELSKYQSKFDIINTDFKTYYNFYTFFFFQFITYNIENTMSRFTGIKGLFFPSFYSYEEVPPLTSSKLLSNLLMIELEKGISVFRLFKKIKYIRIKELNNLRSHMIEKETLKSLNNPFSNKFTVRLKKQKSKKNKLKLIAKFLNLNFNIKYNEDDIFYKHRKNKALAFNKLGRFHNIFTGKKKELILFLFKLSKENLNKNMLNNYINVVNHYFSNLKSSAFLFKNIKEYKKRYPLIGLRIECSGTNKKGKQSRTIAYHNIIKDYRLFGKMPTQSMLADIDYDQSFARTKSGSVGIKVWMFFFTKLYDKHYNLKSIL